MAQQVLQALKVRKESPVQPEPLGLQDAQDVLGPQAQQDGPGLQLRLTLQILPLLARFRLEAASNSAPILAQMES